MPRSPEHRRPDSRDALRVTPATLRAWPLPPSGDDKKSRGTVLVVGGARQTPGAVILAAEAALRTGAGRLKMATALSLAPHVAVALPEAAVHGLPETTSGDIDPARAAEPILELAGGTAAVLLGPGLLDVTAASELLGAVVPGLDTSTVIDALALGYVTGNPHALQTPFGTRGPDAQPRRAR